MMSCLHNHHYYCYYYNLNHIISWPEKRWGFEKIALGNQKKKLIKITEGTVKYGWMIWDKRIIFWMNTKWIESETKERNRKRDIHWFLSYTSVCVCLVWERLQNECIVEIEEDLETVKGLFCITVCVSVLGTISFSCFISFFTCALVHLDQFFSKERKKKYMKNGFFPHWENQTLNKSRKFS